MQRYAVIGLGRFGSRLASNLARSGKEVIGIDSDESIIEEMRDRVTLAVALDATDEDAMRANAVHEVDVGIVAAGEPFQSAILVTVLLKQIGVDHVISRASSKMEAQILTRVGADEVILPEDEAADRLASRLESPMFLSRFDIAEGTSIVEMRTPEHWVGKSLMEIKPRTELGIHVVAIKSSPGRMGEGEEAIDRATTLQMPMPQRDLGEDDVLLLMGRNEDLEKLRGNE